MLSEIRVVTRVAAALAAAAALTFGTTQALADVDCTPLPPHSCVGQGPTFCPDLCDNNGYEYGGQCFTGLDCCICFEK